MAKFCSHPGCKRRSTSKKDLFCLKHAKLKLKQLDELGYFEPMEQTTIDGTIRLSNRKFLTDLEMMKGSLTAPSEMNFSGSLSCPLPSSNKPPTSP